MIPLVTIQGPTASGKSALAQALAMAFGSGIISADSRQVYQGLDIGTAKPTLEEQRQVPHHLIDIIDIKEVYDAGSFARDAAGPIREYASRGLIPIVCGGTGLYVKALLEGICELPPIPGSIKLSLSARIARATSPDDRIKLLNEMHAELRAIDPEFAARVSVTDPQRIIRGLEVWMATGIPLSEHWRQQQPSETYKTFNILIMPPREQLYKRINLRMAQMLESGLIDEIKSLLEQGYTWSDPGLNSLGYKEFKPYLEGTCSLEDAINLAAQHSRNYAKRQVTWYRKLDFDLTIASNELNMSVLESRIREVLSLI